MGYKISEVPSGIFVALDGDLDHHMAMLIRIPIDKYINENKIETLTFDFKNVGFMDSSGIGLIMGRYKLLSEKGGKIYVINTSNAINRIFQISGLYKLVNI